jgi:hypothetical protein
LNLEGIQREELLKLADNISSFKKKKKSQLLGIFSK